MSKPTLAAGIVATPEQASVIAYTHHALPLWKVQASPDNQRDPSSKWSAFVSCDGASLYIFAGRSFATQAHVERAVSRMYADRLAGR